MSTPQLTALERYQEYYSIADVVPINVQPLALQQALPDWDTFNQEIPDVFRLASELHSAETSSMAALRHMGEAAELIAQVIQQQNRKLNLLLGYVLRNEDHPEQRQQTIELGGGGVRYLNHNSELVVGQQVQLKLFLTSAQHSQAAAIYAYAEVAALEATEKGQLVTLAFSRILDSDREIIVRASLHAQTRLLKKRAQERDK
ncbi:PilZ domain-containing protein [Aliidiomarina quisquiliarum]|uniref:PilZ domain-containing protein n=1 Tax=Aliidiomarina quisquiliarum TaxID=2938947 RepID=UPI00208F23EA|nr:PilZ domain-containing protein [Aliidiomarina quisquiliarum]MCO4320402.1 PilZ domain-containing protein [Aliidiomarina quisquiliarum]